MRRVQTSATLKLYLTDISKNELIADLNSTEDLSSTGTYKLLSESSTEIPWAVLVGHYSFGNKQAGSESVGAVGLHWFRIGISLVRPG